VRTEEERQALYDSVTREHLPHYMKRASCWFVAHFEAGAFAGGCVVLPVTQESSPPHVSFHEIQVADRARYSAVAFQIMAFARAAFSTLPGYFVLHERNREVLSQLASIFEIDETFLLMDEHPHFRREDGFLAFSVAPMRASEKVKRSGQSGASIPPPAAHNFCFLFCFAPCPPPPPRGFQQQKKKTFEPSSCFFCLARTRP
jgi:hypothetical protein